MAHELLDALDEVSYATEGAAANCPLGDDAEPAFDLVEPGGGRGREVQVVAGVAREPGAHLAMLVGAVVIEDQVHVQRRRDVGLEVSEEG